MRPVLDDLIDYGLSRGSSDRLADLRIGLGYTAARLESGKPVRPAYCATRLAAPAVLFCPLRDPGGRPLPEILPSPVHGMS